MEVMRAVSSPQTNAPAPSLMSNVEVESCAENVLAEQTVFSCLVDRYLKALNGDRIFRADVDIALCGADRIAGNSHSLEHNVGVAFENRTVHECTGVALVGVTAYILLWSDNGLLRTAISTCGESAAASAAQTGRENGLNYIFGSHFLEDLAECLITVHCDILVDTLGIDDAAVSERNSLLLLVEAVSLRDAAGFFSRCLPVSSYTRRSTIRPLRRCSETISGISSAVNLE